MSGPTRARTVRRARHLVVALAGSVAAAAMLARLLPDDASTRSRLSIVLAYISLGALLLTLVVGPLQVVRGRPNPRSTGLRRDLGLLAGSTGLAHVVLSLGNHFGGDVGEYFFDGGRIGPGTVRLDGFGVGSWTGAAATLVLVVLVAISNDRAVRRLGRRWKQVQRANYVLAPLAFLHTAVFWDELEQRRAVWMPVVIAAVLTTATQLGGVVATLRRRSAS